MFTVLFVIFLHICYLAIFTVLLHTIKYAVGKGTLTRHKSCSHRGFVIVRSTLLPDDNKFRQHINYGNVA